MKKAIFIKKAVKVEYEDLNNYEMANYKLVMENVTENDMTFLVVSGAKLQCWVVRNGLKSPIMRNKHSCKAVCA